MRRLGDNLLLDKPNADCRVQRIDFLGTGPRAWDAVELLRFGVLQHSNVGTTRTALHDKDIIPAVIVQLGEEPSLKAKQNQGLGRLRPEEFATLVVEVSSFAILQRETSERIGPSKHNFRCQTQLPTTDTFNKIIEPARQRRKIAWLISYIHMYTYVKPTPSISLK